MDAFYDGWLRRTGTVSVVGPSHRAGEVPDRSVVNMQPPVRSACRRIRTRCVVLANGMVTACDQDQEGRLALGSLRERTLSEIWLSAACRALRAVHEASRWAEHRLCSKCTDWHRP
jgi:radical SAM protein with 4Fe4S-binding SPASM domain